MAPIITTSFSQPSLGRHGHSIDLFSGSKPTQQTSPPRTPPAGVHKDSASDIEHLSVSRFPPVDPGEEPHVAIIGCGYVGEHLIKRFSSRYSVLGFEVSTERVESLRKVYDQEDSRVSFTLAPKDLSRATHFLVSVPTLLLEDKSINTSYIQLALTTIGRYARRGSTIVVESSVAVGMTRQLVGPLAKQKGFYAGMSPERVDPGRTEPPAQRIPKIISGLDDVVPGSLEAITRLYSPVFDTIFPVSKPEVAEMMKLYENCQRMVCIAYANEMADACAPHGIDPYEVCRAAATKPFGYMPYTPSLGVGGHCIPVNPYYLLSNSDFPLLEACTEKMWQRPVEIGQKALELLGNIDGREEQMRPAIHHVDSCMDMYCAQTVHNAALENKDMAIEVTSRRSSTSRARVLIVGIGFKPGQSVLSNSPGQKLAQSLADSGRVDVMFADPLVEQSAIPLIPRLDDESWNKEVLETFDMIIVAIKQVGPDLDVLQELDGPKIQMWCA
ncbi:hypothetical protein BKA67DRAFT_654482 [Truncatella angustata]|uniref:Nucleotide sugar dehydrogenase n=1 Tax=Truncatella angustata TaxID=152316 RepID=A0A9P8UZQ9_9PEZI|nr:uncharacterized protein BKA67DRAFT_654482 [Truncatella angustata]KAH6661363.1 hypothetical protein BKA67DRAFT_654482 [Truncatella angustata]KAH8202162.1 hypothetical protein TruAng_003637 [Truncatella angustata]